MEDKESLPLLNTSRQSKDKTDHESNSQPRTLTDIVWPYLVLGSSFLSYSLTSGFNSGIVGVITEAIGSRFNIPLDDASWAAAIHTAVILMAGPCSPLLSRSISMRKIQLLGAFLALSGLGLCWFATKPWHVVLLFGVVNGAGFALIRGTLFAVLIYHFDLTKLRLATGIAILGVSAGFLIIPMPSGWLFATYGFNKGMLLLSPLMLVHLLGVIFYSQDGGCVPEENLPERKTISESLKLIAVDLKVWAYVWNGFLKKFGLSGFFTLIEKFAMNDLSLSLSEAGSGPAMFGVMSMIGNILILITHVLKMEYSTLLPYSISTTGVGVFMIVAVQAASKTGYLVLFGGCGLCYGLLNGNIVNLASELVGTGDMALAYGLESSMEGIGGLSGPPSAGYVAVNMSLKFGILLSGGMASLSGIVTGLVTFSGIISTFKAKCYSQNTQQSR